MGSVLIANIRYPDIWISNSLHAVSKGQIKTAKGGIGYNARLEGSMEGRNRISILLANYFVICIAQVEVAIYSIGLTLFSMTFKKVYVTWEANARGDVCLGHLAKKEIVTKPDNILTPVITIITDEAGLAVRGLTYVEALLAAVTTKIAAIRTKGCGINFWNGHDRPED